MKTKLTFIFFWLTVIVRAQDYPYNIEYRDFVRYDLNKIEFYKDSSAYINLYQKFDDLIFRGEGQINVVHFGGSHVQAGALPGRFSERLQTMHPGLVGSRGFVFPYNLTRTNVPRNYYIRHTGTWTSCRNVEYKKKCTLGVSGLSTTTTSTASSLNISLRPDSYLPYTFNRVRVLHDVSASSFRLNIQNVENEIIEVNTEQGYTLYQLKSEANFLEITFSKTDSLQNQFTLYGISLETDQPGITYHGIGVNGSTIPAFLRCDLLENQLKALRPDWIIMTLGTNDAYSKKFNPEYYYTNYDSLITRIKTILPNVPILLTVPNDSYLFKRYVNQNTQLVSEQIKKLSAKHNLASWDFYNIMGGLNSVTLWHKEGLTANDKLHFSKAGYFLQADLLFNAFLKSYDNYTENYREGELSQIEYVIKFPDLTNLNQP
jgi:lysophospholipase L1-like esterase